MEKFILDILKYLISPTLLSIFVNIFMNRNNNKRSSLKETPTIFIKQIRNNEKFQALNCNLRHDTYYVLKINSCMIDDKEFTNIDVEIVSSSDINIEKNMLYIHVKNDYMEGAEIRVLDTKGRELKFDSSELQYLSTGQSLGIFFDFYDRPIKLYILDKQVRYEYDIHKDEGSIKCKIKK